MKLIPGSTLAAALTLSLTACMSVTPPEPDPAGLTNRVSGVLQDWGTRGTATIETQYRPSGGDQSQFVTLSKGTVNADGSFSLDLPSASVVAPYLVRF